MKCWKVIAEQFTVRRKAFCFADYAGGKQAIAFIQVAAVVGSGQPSLIWLLSDVAFWCEGDRTSKSVG
jgi:hypothetical protein